MIFAVERANIASLPLAPLMSFIISFYIRPPARSDSSLELVLSSDS